MAIRFVDVKSDGDEGAKPAPARRAHAPEAAPEPAPVEDAPAAEADAPEGGEAPTAGLPHAKPGPKRRGTPMSAAGAGKPKAEDAPAASLLDGLLPGLQAHAKPTPKPRGRKKAFG